MAFHILSNYWFPAAHLDYYVARPANIRLVAAGPLSGIHHYAWLNTYRTTPSVGDDAYYIAVSNYFDPPPPTITRCFAQVAPPLVIPQRRQGLVVRHFLIYRLKGYTGGLPRNGVVE